MANGPGDDHAPSIRYAPAPNENRTPPADYRENFDRDYAQETARSLVDYLVAYSAEQGNATTWTQDSNKVTGVAPSGAKLEITTLLHDAFDMDYWPAADELGPSKNGLVLMHMMPGYDRDHMVAWARHFVVNGRFE